MEKSVLLKWLLILGGWFEVITGILFMFIHLFLEPMGVPSGPPIFNQLAGAFFICFGILLIYNGREIEKYAIITKVNCLFRFIVQPAAIYSMILFPVFIPLLVGTAIYDLVWAIIVIYLLKKCDFW